MAELGFVSKAFIISLVLVALMQVKVGNNSIENTAHHWIASSPIAGSLQNVASGAVLMIRNATKVGTEFVSKTLGQNHSSTQAGRMNLEFKRSARFEEEQQSKTDRNN